METLPKELIEWWEGFRPNGWTIEDHLNNPTVNCKTEQEKNLALYIVKNIK
jgi:hypothetical protein